MASQAPPKRLFAVIEDDAAVLNSLQFALEAQGHEVCLFERAGDAIASGKIMEADCLLIDYALPDMDGLTMLAALRRRGLTAPAVIVASNPSTRCRRDAEKAGAPVIEKPIMGDALNVVLLSILADRV
jgi:two-component system, LuxR family, response regulator FixJ